jgi:hypothetical protein
VQIFRDTDYEDGTKEAENWVEQRLLALLQGRSAGEIAKDIRRYAARRRLSASACKPVNACARYLVKHARFLHYNCALAEGLPIATGVIEGACRCASAAMAMGAPKRTPAKQAPAPVPTP